MDTTVRVIQFDDMFFPRTQTVRSVAFTGTGKECADYISRRAILPYRRFVIEDAAAPMAQPSNDPPMAQAARDTAPGQACMMLGTCDAVAALASKQQIPAALLDVLAGYALAGLDANRQAAILADLGTGRIVSTGALTKRCKAALAAQAQDATFAWGR